MKKILVLVASLFIALSMFSNVGASSIFGGDTVDIPYCEGDDCGLEEGIEKVGEAGIDGVVLTGTASEYIQKIVVYILGFLGLVSVILIIYAGFLILTSAGNEDQSKKGKNIIIYTIIGLVIIFLAGPIIDFVLDVLTQ